MTFIDTNVLVHAAADASLLLDRARAALARGQRMAWLARGERRTLTFNGADFRRFARLIEVVAL